MGSIDEELWEAVNSDDLGRVRSALRDGAGFTYIPGHGPRGEDALLRAISRKREKIIPTVLRAYPYANSHAGWSPILAAIEQHELGDTSVLKVLAKFVIRLDEKEKGQLPLHAAMLRKTPAIAIFLLSKRRVQKAADATYKGLNALELLLTRNEALIKDWGAVVKKLMDLGLKVRSKTQVEKRNQGLLGKQVAEKQAKVLDKATPQATAPTKRRTI